jgi:hypothetical protein
MEGRGPPVRGNLGAADDGPVIVASRLCDFVAVANCLHGTVTRTNLVSYPLRKRYIVQPCHPEV